MNKEIQRLNWFIENSLAKDMCGDNADEAFIAYSEGGIKPDLSKLQNPMRYRQLNEAKRWQGITIHQLWEQGILDGSVPYWTLLGGENPKEILPRNIVDFMKKEMFKGVDKEIIENCYQDVQRYWTWWKRILFNFFKEIITI